MEASPSRNKKTLFELMVVACRVLERLPHRMSGHSFPEPFGNAGEGSGEG
jgi:hypothetical protein